MTGFVAHREGRWEYTMDCVEHIEIYNCVHGCVHAHDATPDMPGGTCGLLIRVALEEPVPEIIDNGVTLHCTARQSP